MKKFIFLFFLLFNIWVAQAQLYATRNGFIGFYSKTSLEDIKAENKQVYAVIDAAKKKYCLQFAGQGFCIHQKINAGPLQ